MRHSPACATGFSVRAPVAQDEAGQSRASHGEEMSAAMKALVLVFGAAMIMAEYGPPRLIGYAEARNMKKTDHRNGMDRRTGFHIAPSISWPSRLTRCLESAGRMTAAPVGGRVMRQVGAAAVAEAACRKSALTERCPTLL